RHPRAERRPATGELHAGRDGRRDPAERHAGGGIAGGRGLAAGAGGAPGAQRQCVQARVGRARRSHCHRYAGGGGTQAAPAPGGAGRRGPQLHGGPGLSPFAICLRLLKVGAYGHAAYLGCSVVDAGRGVRACRRAGRAGGRRGGAGERRAECALIVRRRQGVAGAIGSGERRHAGHGRRRVCDGALHRRQRVDAEARHHGGDRP
ncbi:conserved hypothetical protein, partial [Ricinus communis]